MRCVLDAAKGLKNNDYGHELCDADVAGRVGDNETGWICAFPDCISCRQRGRNLNSSLLTCISLAFEIRFRVHEVRLW